MNATSSCPVLPLQEFIYAKRRTAVDSRRSACVTSPEFNTDVRRLNFTGECMFPWMFERGECAGPFAGPWTPMEDTHFGMDGDADQLACNEVPLQPPSTMTICTSIPTAAGHVVSRPTTLLTTTNGWNMTVWLARGVRYHLQRGPRNRGDLQESTTKESVVDQSKPSDSSDTVIWAQAIAWAWSTPQRR